MPVTYDEKGNRIDLPYPPSPSRVEQNAYGTGPRLPLYGGEANPVAAPRAFQADVRKVDQAPPHVPSMVGVADGLFDAMLPGAGQPPAGAIPNAPRPSQADVRRIDNQLGTGVPATNGSGMKTVSAPAQGESPFTPYASKNPRAVVDDDIEFTHTLSRLYGLAGRGDKSMAYRDMYLRLNQQRYSEVSDMAIRSFLAGDVSTTIDMFNHMVPNGRKITGYRTNPDGTYAFQYEDGKSDTLSQEQIANSLSAFKDTGLIGKMMLERNKATLEFQKEKFMAAYKGSIDIQVAMQKGIIDAEKAKAIELFKAQLPDKDVKITMDSLGQNIFATQGNKIYRLEEVDVMGKKQFQPRHIGDVPLPSISANSAIQQRPGMSINPLFK